MYRRSKLLSLKIERPRALGVHFEMGLRAFEDRDLAGVVRNRSAIGLLPEGGAASLEFMALDWRARWLDERHDEAVAVAREIVQRYPDDPDGYLELAQILCDLNLEGESRDVLERGTGCSPDDPELWYELGLVAERIGDDDLRRRAFHHVWRLEHDEAPNQRLFLSDEAFVGAVEETIARLPPLASRALGNVAIIIEDYPDEWIVTDDVSDPRLLGLFDGPDRAMEHSVGAVIEGPARIYLFRWNIERTCGSEEEAREQVAVTILHEIGHYLGLDEDALHYRGLG